MGLTSLESMDEFIAINRLNYDAYADGLSEIPGLTLAQFGPDISSNYHYVIVQVDQEKCRIARDVMHRILWAENVLARRYFYPGCHRAIPYKDALGTRQLPVTDHLAASLLSLPTGGDLRPDRVIELCRLLKFIVAHAADISTRAKSLAWVDQ
jgi:dTDP-4-amino-4,6-dideoxygalactose transaminase